MVVKTNRQDQEAQLTLFFFTPRSSFFASLRVHCLISNRIRNTHTHTHTYSGKLLNSSYIFGLVFTVLVYMWMLLF